MIQHAGPPISQSVKLMADWRISIPNVANIAWGVDLYSAYVLSPLVDRMRRLMSATPEINDRRTRWDQTLVCEDSAVSQACHRRDQDFEALGMGTAVRP